MSNTLKSIECVPVDGDITNHLYLTVCNGGARYGKCLELAPLYKSRTVRLNMEGVKHLIQVFSDVVADDYEKHIEE